MGSAGHVAGECIKARSVPLMRKKRFKCKAPAGLSTTN